MIKLAIEDYRFGRMVINGKAYTDDLKIVAGNVLPDWWRNKGHLVSAADVEDILDANPEVVVIGTGNSGRMRVDSALAGTLEAKGIQLIAKPTVQALQDFNRLVRKGANVAAGFHLTC